MNKRIGIWGWWQGKNLGDNWILSSMKKMFGEECIPLDTSILNFNNLNLDFVICGGGGLFVNDIPEPWNNISNISVPFGIFGVGTEHGVDLVDLNKLIKKSSFFYIRDRMTFDKMKLKDESMIISDITFFNPLSFDGIYGNDILFVWRDKDFDGSLYSKEHWKKYIGEYTSKQRWIENIKKISSSKIVYSSFDSCDNSVNPLIKNVGLIVSQRYHGIIAAIQKGIPCIALDICPKIRAIMDESGLGDFCIKISQVDKFSSLYERCMNEKDNIREKMFLYKEKSKQLVTNAGNKCKNIIGI